MPYHSKMISSEFNGKTLSEVHFFKKKRENETPDDSYMMWVQNSLLDMIPCIEMLFNTFSNRADPDQAALVRAA